MVQTAKAAIGRDHMYTWCYSSYCGPGDEATCSYACSVHVMDACIQGGLISTYVAVTKFLHNSPKPCTSYNTVHT